MVMGHVLFGDGDGMCAVGDDDGLMVRVLLVIVTLHVLLVMAMVLYCW